MIRHSNTGGGPIAFIQQSGAHDEIVTIDFSRGESMTEDMENRHQIEVALVKEGIGREIINSGSSPSNIFIQDISIEKVVNALAKGGVVRIDELEVSKVPKRKTDPNLRWIPHGQERYVLEKQE